MAFIFYVLQASHYSQASDHEERLSAEGSLQTRLYTVLACTWIAWIDVLHELIWKWPSSKPGNSSPMCGQPVLSGCVTPA